MRSQALGDQRLTGAADLVEDHINETLTDYAFLDEHWQKIFTNTPRNRIMGEIRCCTRLVGISRWSKLSQSGGGQMETYGRWQMQQPEVYEYGTVE